MTLASTRPLNVLESPRFESYLPENCPFESIFIDVTHRCNMACHNCYIPNRTIPDLDAAWLDEIFSRLPRGRFVRLVGAEPTVRKDLPELIQSVRKNGHHPVLMTNGLKLNDRSYLSELKNAGLQVVYLSMNGAFDDELYYEIDAMRCAEQKTRAFENLRAEHIYTSIGMIIARGINEQAVDSLLKACQSTRNVREFHIRSIGPIGRYMKTASLTLDELIQVFNDALGTSEALLERRVRTNNSIDFTLGRLRVQLTQWPDLGSKTRGRLTPEGMIAPAFEHGISNEGGY
ncbi:MAG TPA: radical SAM protein [Blastocatellia bacterium]|nr:radical SAM protein [Blastocatellia bacterium]